MWWKVIDNVAGEIVETEDYWVARGEAEERVAAHGTTFDYRYRGKHWAIKTRIVEDKASKTLTIERI